MAHHGIHGNAPKLDPAFACGDNLARQSLGLWRQRPGRQLGADHAEWGEGSSTCAWAEAREDQKGVLGRHRRPGGLGCHRRRSLTAHRWRGSRHATRGSPGGGDFVHMAAPLGLRGGGGRSHRRPHLRPQLAPMPEHRRRRPRRLNAGRGRLKHCEHQALGKF